MLFKNAYLFQLQSPAKDTVEAMLRNLSGDHSKFKPCTPAQATSVGFVPALGDGELLYQQEACTLFCVRTETKILPPSVVRELLDERIDSIESAQGRKVYRSERLSLKDEIVQDCLPRAFSKHRDVRGYIDVTSRLLIIDTATAVTAENVANHLRQAIGGLSILPLMGQESAETALTSWLSEIRDMHPFRVGFECEMQSNIDEGSGKYKGEDLHGSDAVQSMINESMRVKSLDMHHPDGLSFKCKRDWILARLRWDDALINEANKQEGESDLDRHAADLAIQIPTLRKVVDDLGKALGGWEHQTNAEV